MIGPLFGSSRSGSSLPGSIDYAYIVAKAKVDLDAAITGPTSFGIRFKVPASPGDVVGGLRTTATGLEFTDGTNSATLTTTLPAAGEDVVAAVEFNNGAMRVGRLA